MGLKPGWSHGPAAVGMAAAQFLCQWWDMVLQPSWIQCPITVEVAAAVWSYAPRSPTVSTNPLPIARDILMIEPVVLPKGPNLFSVVQNLSLHKLSSFY